MPLKFNSINIEKATFNNTELDKIRYNGTTIWERIQHKTGNLYNMTSNNAPAPFTVTDISTANLGGESSSGAWKCFGSGCFAKIHNVNGRYTGGQLLFNSPNKHYYPIKISAACASEDGGGGYTTGFRIEVDVKLTSGSWQNIIRKDVSNGYQSVSATMNGKTEVVGIRVKAIFGSGPQQYMCVYSCSITEWNEK